MSSLFDRLSRTRDRRRPPADGEAAVPRPAAAPAAEDRRAPDADAAARPPAATDVERAAPATPDREPDAPTEVHAAVEVPGPDATPDRPRQYPGIPTGDPEPEPLPAIPTGDPEPVAADDASPVDASATAVHRAVAPSAAPAGASTTDDAPTPDAAPPTPAVPTRAGVRGRGRMRRRLRYLRRVRELGYRDLGGLVFELRRAGVDNPLLVDAKVEALQRLDAELHVLEHALRDYRPIEELHEPGVSVCVRCGALHGSDARFCPQCGSHVATQGAPPDPAGAPTAPHRTEDGATTGVHATGRPGREAGRTTSHG